MKKAKNIEQSIWNNMNKTQEQQTGARNAPRRNQNQKVGGDQNAAEQSERRKHTQPYYGCDTLEAGCKRLQAEGKLPAEEGSVSAITADSDSFRERMMRDTEPSDEWKKLSRAVANEMHKKLGRIPGSENIPAHVSGFSSLGVAYELTPSPMNSEQHAASTSKNTEQQQTGEGNAPRKISQMAWRRWVKLDNGDKVDSNGDTWHFVSFNKDGNRGARASINVVKVASHVPDNGGALSDPDKVRRGTNINPH